MEPPTIIDLLSLYPVLETICRYLGPYEIGSLKCTSRSAKGCFTKNKNYNICLSTFLNKSFDYAYEIIHLMHIHKIVIGGNKATIAIWPDLDDDGMWEFHTYGIVETNAICYHLTIKEDMQLVYSKNYYLSSGSSIYSKIMYYEHEEKDNKVKVVESCFHSLSSICTSPTTATKCFITSYYIYVLVPKLMRRRIVKPGYVPLSNIIGNRKTHNHLLNDIDIQCIIYRTIEEMSRYTGICTVFEDISEYINNISTTTDKLMNFRISRIPHNTENSLPDDDWKWFSNEYVSIVNY